MSSDRDKVLVVDIEPRDVNLTPGEVFKWCSCGRAETGLYCDGIHKQSTNFKSVKTMPTKTETKKFCMCKLTMDPSGLCDNSHLKLQKSDIGTLKTFPDGGGAQRGYKPWLMINDPNLPPVVPRSRASKFWAAKKVSLSSDTSSTDSSPSASVPGEGAKRQFSTLAKPLVDAASMGRVFKRLLRR